jgi:prevent-host-death family protein
MGGEGSGFWLISISVYRGFLTVAGRELYSLIKWSEEFMAPPISANNGIVVSALRARANFGRILDDVENRGRSLVIEKRGTPRAVLLSLREYVKLAAPEPEILRIIGEEAKCKGTNLLTSRQIDREVKAARAQRKKSSC